MENHQKSIEELEKELMTSAADGIKESSCKERITKYGTNELREEAKESLLVKFLKEFTDPLIIILLIAAVVSVVVDPSEWIESIIILVVVLLNAILGVYQENNAEKSLEALKKLSSPTAKVIRDGIRKTIPSADVCVGDLIVIEAGDYIASDGRIVASMRMQVDESALTGESMPVNKTTDVIEKDELALGDKKNMVFASTMCTYGRGLAIVTSTGMNNEVGKIADMLQKNEEGTTPLQMKLAQISKTIGIMCLGICAVVFILEMMTGMGALDAFKTAVALAVAAIPEGLATVVTIVLSIGVSKMVRYNAIVRKLPAVETLGCCSVICSDKTGTLTQNKMTIVKTYTIGDEIKSFTERADDKTREMLQYFTLCSDGEIVEEDGSFKGIGDPTETAFVYASYLLGDTKNDLNAKYKRIEEIAFDPDRKLMTVFLKTDDGILQVTKGAPDVVFELCVDKDLKEAKRINEVMTKDALRVLAVAIRKLDSVDDEPTSEAYEKDLSFVGLAGMIDPPRAEVKEAIAQAKLGGINTVMITGDHLNTATAIAKDLDILKEGDLAINGADLDKMSDEELASKIEDIKVYARVAPEHKVRIVSAFQKRGEVVAMTGDGVNDSPALKAADIGCAMGITGTDVSKSASDMVLTDDNFATIISAVKQGRGIYANIKKDVHFLLSSNIGEVITIFGASLIQVLFGIPLGTPLLPIHILWVNLITDTLPAFALGMEPVDPDVIYQKPRPKNESFFAGGLGFKVAYQGVLVGLLTLTSYMIGNNDSHEIGMTMAFITLVLVQLVHSFNVKSEKSVFNKQVLNNKYLWGATIIGIVLLLVITYVPFLNDIFELAALDFYHCVVAVGLALVMLVVMEIVKVFRRMKNA